MKVITLNEFRRFLEQKVESEKFTNRIDRFFVEMLGKKCYFIGYIGAGSNRIFIQIADEEKYLKALELYRKYCEYVGHESLDSIFNMLAGYVMSNNKNL